MADFNVKSGQNRAILALALVSLTLAVLAGIKFMMSDGDSVTPPAAAGPRDIFSASEDEAPPPELSPLSRSDNPGGGSLDMFSKTNAGYYGEDEPEPAGTAPKAAEPKVARSTATAARRKAPPAKAKTAGTVVPRMKMVPFKSITPTNVTPSGAGGRQNMPDLSEMMRKAQEQAGQTGSGD